MLQDEAVWDLFEALDAEPHATLRITVDHGEYQAFFATGVTPCEGERKPTLTDALASLVVALDA